MGIDRNIACLLVAICTASSGAVAQTPPPGTLASLIRRHNTVPTGDHRPGFTEPCGRTGRRDGMILERLREQMYTYHQGGIR